MLVSGRQRAVREHRRDSTRPSILRGKVNRSGGGSIAAKHLAPHRDGRWGEKAGQNKAGRKNVGRANLGASKPWGEPFQDPQGNQAFPAAGFSRSEAQSLIRIAAGSQNGELVDICFLLAVA